MTNNKTSFFAVILVLFSTLFTSAGQILFKFASNTITFSTDFISIISTLTDLTLIFGLIAYGLGAGVLIIALKYGELSILYPIYSLSYVWVSILSPIFFSTDSMNPVKWLGVLIIILGVTFVGRGGVKL